MSIASEINRINNTVLTQAELIEQIKVALQGKAANEGEGGGITPSGTKNISSNGVYDVTLYEKANVEVPIPNGYIKPNGVKSITQNGDYDVTAFARTNVDVPPPEGFIKPTGTKDITENGTHDATEYASVNVDVPIPDGYIVPTGEISITQNGSVNIAEYERANINVPIPEGYADVTSTTATADEVLYRQRFVGADGVVTTGTMPNIGTVTKTLDTTTKSYTIDKGYHYGDGKVSIVTEEKSVTPTKETQSVIPTMGKVLSKVIVQPIPDGYVLPAGTLEITENGSYGVFNYAGVSVNVPSKEPVVQPLEITENGTYTPPEGIDGYSPITVNVAGSGGSGYTDLPEGYKRVDYIQFTGEQTVDTEIICNQNTKIQAAFTREKSSAHYLFGVASSGNTASVTAYLGGSFRFGNKSATKTPNTNADMIYSVVLSSSEVTITNSKTTISGVNAFETVGTLQLGGCRNSSGTDGAPQFVGKIQFFAMWESDEQVLKLVPVVGADGQYRFFDMVSKTFFDSITDTPLSGGNW